MEHFKKREESSYKSGTTIVGLIGKDFAVLASDKQGSMGGFAYDLNAQKLHKLNSTISVGLAGSLGDAQQVIRLMKAEINLYEIEREKVMSPKAAATYLANYLNANRYYPYFAGFIMVGFKDKPEIFSTDVVGGFGAMKDFTSIGSGSTFAIGVLEAGYKKDMSKNDAIKLITDAIKASRKRDIYTGGDQIDIMVISKSGIEEIVH